MARIYVASLLDYNCGDLYGEWFDTEDYDTATDLEQDVESMLRKSPNQALGFGLAEEFAIHDDEGFGGFRIYDYMPLSFVFHLAELIEEHGVEFAVFLEHVWTDHTDTVDDLDSAESAFRDAWIGHMSVREYAEEFADEMMEDSKIPESFRQFFDYDKYANDMELGGDVSEFVIDGEYYLFRNN